LFGEKFSKMHMASLKMSFSGLKIHKNRYGISDLLTSVNIENLKNRKTQFFSLHFLFRFGMSVLQ